MKAREESSSISIEGAFLENPFSRSAAALIVEENREKKRPFRKSLYIQGASKKG